jgi:ferrous iron transport protein A
MRKKCTLADLELGKRARVLEVARESPVRRRLMELGFTPGAEVHLLTAAPMGGPLKVFVRGYRLSMRRQDAAYVICE